MLHMPRTFPPQGWWERLESLAGRRRDTVAVGVFVAAFVFGGIGLSSRGAPAVIAPPARATPSPSASSVGSQIVVHVAGAVRHPGVIALPVGARVADAIAKAGGALVRADLDQLNLAAFVVDGSQVLVPARGETSPVPSTPLPGSTQATTVDLNSADQALLETVPGLGPVKAGAIIAFRTEIGTFESIEQLLEVSGIGPATLESIRPFISI